MDNPFFTRDELNAYRDRPAEDRTKQKPGVGWLRAERRPLYIFGCGEGGRWTRDVIGRDLVVGWLDNDREKWNREVDGLKVLSPNDAAARLRAENALVVMAVYNDAATEAIQRQCGEFGLETVDYVDMEQLLRQPVPVEELAENPHAAECFLLLEDEESRNVFRSAVRYRTTMDKADLPPYTARQYFVDFIPSAKYRDFVDVGAYDGDTLREYLAVFGDDFDSYTALEPDPAREAGLRRTAGDDPRIVVFMAGASDHAGTIAMRRCGATLRANPAGEMLLHSVRLDDALKNRRVGLIKMDVEGEEPNALEGARKIIVEQRPALAIAIYHQPDHLWKIPLWIRDLDPGYRLFVRHHSRSPGETICYAAPKE